MLTLYPEKSNFLTFFVIVVSHLVDQMLEYDNVNLSKVPNELYHPSTENFASMPLNNLITKAKEYIHQIITEFTKVLAKQHNPYLVKAQDYIKSNFNNNELSLQSLSDELDMNSSYLSKLFKDNLGVTFTAYINKVRIDQSRNLLENNQHNINEIAELCGFNSAQSFIRVFKKYIGDTPGNYKKNHTN